MSKQANFDLSQYEASDTAVLDVQTPHGEPLLVDGKPVQIVLCGPGSEEYLRAQAEIDRANQERLFQSMRGKAPKDAAAEQRAAQTKKLTACTREIRNFPVTAQELYSNPKLGWLRSQVAVFVEDWTHFLRGSEQS